MMNTERASTLKNDSLMKGQEPPSYVSLSKDLTVVDTGSSNEFVFTEPMVPSTTANSPFSVTNLKDASVTEGSSVVTFQATNDSPTMSKRIQDEEALRIRPTEHLYYDATSKQEEAMNLFTEKITSFSTLPSSMSGKDNPTENVEVSQDNTMNETTISIKTSTPYYDIVTENKSQFLENTPQELIIGLKKDTYHVETTHIIDERNSSLETDFKEPRTVSYLPTDISTTNEHMEVTKEDNKMSKVTGIMDSSTETSLTGNQKQTKPQYVVGNDSPIHITEDEDIYNSTRFPKRIQAVRDRYPAEGRVRPARPDPGYTHREDQIDIVRPYRPDSPVHQYPYYRPTPDNRTPVIRQDAEYTRPARPDPDTQRASFKPNYSFTKPTVSTSETPTAKPYRPTFNRPYVPQGSFGRPYRPDYHRPAPKPSEDGLYNKASTSGASASTHEAEIFEHSRADYEYTRQSESGSPSHLKAKPSTDSVAISTEEDSVKVGFTPNIETARPFSYYPKPVSSFPSSETSVKPFSIGTVISAKNLTRVECKYKLSFTINICNVLNNNQKENNNIIMFLQKIYSFQSHKYLNINLVFHLP